MFLFSIHGFHDEIQPSKKLNHNHSKGHETSNDALVYTPEKSRFTSEDRQPSETQTSPSVLAMHSCEWLERTKFSYSTHCPSPSGNAHM